MGADRYEVVVVNAKIGRQLKREWRAPELLKSVKWLKRMNAQGGDIYIRPLDGPELIVVDALDAEALKGIRRKGLTPAAVIEIAPGRFQAWLKLSDHPLPDRLRKAAVSGLAGMFPLAGRKGRLAGFTNQETKPSRVGRQSYVLAREATGKLAPAARQYLDDIERLVCERAANKQKLIDAEKQRLVAAMKAKRTQHLNRGRSR